MFLFAPKAKVSDGQISKHIINLQICAQTSEEAERELKPQRFYFDTSLCHVASPGMGFLLEENSVAILRMEEEERHGGLSLQNPPQRSSPSPPEAPVTVMSARRLRGGGGEIITASHQTSLSVYSTVHRSEGNRPLERQRS